MSRKQFIKIIPLQIFEEKNSKFDFSIRSQQKILFSWFSVMVLRLLCNHTILDTVSSQISWICSGTLRQMSYGIGYLFWLSLYIFAKYIHMYNCSINTQMRNLPSITLGRALLSPLKCLGHSDPPSSASQNLFYPKTYRH